ncbi:uncharacterized protein An11g00840 [Aspergillus niger]|uniref:Contig An11c0030, genomic contig n=2 Tax=Aspergillus niger TaxID=5061 RepID=A2QVB8_ASPNC|nr:uncharacterized protein An11g00840 [Aspergillus niger]CAK40558.1 unnamed protein product [Aspergillus niger]
MEMPTSESSSIRVAFEGCGHGCLHDIYASVDKAAALKGWDGVDLVIIGGDFQAVRNANDLACMSVPMKYRELGDFHEYYSGQRVAPYLTIFVGGNHEASNHMFELYYGGWVAPNIYYLGAANVIRCGPLRIAGMSGIWKGYDYRRPHFERLPYNSDDVQSIYHIRELDVRKLLQIRTQVDLGLSHDWPKQVERSGDFETLFRKKLGFREDSQNGRLGSMAAKHVLDRLRPAYWFSAHLHVKFAALVQHAEYMTSFLALDKCLPNREFLQLLEINPISDLDGAKVERPYRLQYDKEWLAITRAFANDLHLGDPNARPSADKGDVVYRPQILEEEKWVEENVVKPGKLVVPENFTQTAPVYDPAVPLTTEEMPMEYTNPQTTEFCELIGIENKFDMSDAERQARMARGPRPNSNRGGMNRPPRRGGFGRGRGRGGRGRGNRY